MLHKLRGIAREGGAGAARLDAVGDAVRDSGGSADDVNQHVKPKQ